jgi:hypothetical protein
VGQALGRLAAALCRCERYREAVDAARVAVDVYQQLAGEDRDRFGPDLATALGNLSVMLDYNGLADASYKVARRAIETMAPYFQVDPTLHRTAMCALLKTYIDRGKELGRDPDVGLVGPILEILVADGA